MLRHVSGIPRSLIRMVTWWADFRRQRPEVPLHVVRARWSLLDAFWERMKCWNFHRVLDEEHGGCCSRPCRSCLRWYRTSARSPRGGHARVSGLPRSPATVEKRSSVSVLVPGWNTAAFVKLADVVGHLEVAEGAATLRVGLALRDSLPVEVRHLLEEVVILQQDRAVGPPR